MRRVLGWATPAQALFAICLLALTLAGCGSQSGQWQILNTGFGGHALTLATDPFNADRVYAGADNGVVYTTLADQAGQPIPGQGLPTGARVSSLYPDPQRAGIIYAGTSNGLYRSQDSGQHWAAYGAGLPTTSITAIGGVPDGSLFFAAASGTGVFVSRDHGATWAFSNRGLSAATVNALLCVSASACYAAINTATAFGATGVYATTDGGANWAADATGLPGGAVYALASLPNHSLAASGPTLFAGTTRGVYSSVDGGATWQAANTGLPVGQARALDASTLAPGLLYAGVGDQAYRSTDGGRHWESLAAGLNGLGSPVTGVVAAQGKQSGVVIFAAAGQLARTPPIPGSNNPIPALIATLILLALLPLIIYRVYVTIRRRGRKRRPNIPRGMGAVRGAPTPAGASAATRARAPLVPRNRAKPTLPNPEATTRPGAVGAARTTQTTDAPPAPEAKAQQNGHGKARP